MKSFFEEYGFVILAAIVVILLIAMCTPIGNLVHTQINGIVDSFSSKTTAKFNSVDSGTNSARLAYENDKLMLNVSSGNSTDKFTAYATYTSKGKEVKDQAITSISSASAGKYEVSVPADKDSNVQIKVINDGTQEEFYSNALTVGKAVNSASTGETSKDTTTGSGESGLTFKTVAMIDKNQYFNLASAITNASKGKIVLVDDATSEGFRSDENSIVISLSNYTITFASSSNRVANSPLAVAYNLETPECSLNGQTGTLESFLESNKNGTIKLYKDLEKDSLTVSGGTVIDLNGKLLTVGSLTITGDVTFINGTMKIGTLSGPGTVTFANMTVQPAS